MAGSRTQSLDGAVKQRARILAHYAMTKNVSATCRYDGAPRLSQYLQRYHRGYVSSMTILKLFKVERTWKGVRRPPKQHPPAKTPGESLQVAVGPKSSHRQGQ